MSFGAPGCCPCFGYDKWTADELKVTDKANDEHTYCVYTHELEANDKMFASTNTMKGLTEALEECHFKDGDKKITIVGWSLGGAQAQIAAVRIAVEYNAKVRLITIDSILAFTPDSAEVIADNLIDNDAFGTDKFPQEGKINAQRWVEDDSPASIAPFVWPMMGCCPFSPNKTKYAGCYPFMRKIGYGHISKALILSGYHAGFLPCGGGTPTWNLGCIPKNLCFLCDSNPTYSFKDTEAKERAYVTKAAKLGRFCFCGYLPCAVGSLPNHYKGAFLLWMLYKGAYQNADPAATVGYQPTVKDPAVSPENPEMDRI